MATKGEQTRDAILRAAIARFGREGFRATSVADIARDASVGGTVAYAYWPNKEALFLAAVDEDAAALVGEGLALLDADATPLAWRRNLAITLYAALEHHPLTRRLLAGLEPEVSARVMEIPALADLRKAVAERLAAEQLTGNVRHDIDPVTIGNGVVALVLSLLTSLVLVGGEVIGTYADDVIAVFDAALSPAEG
ncbi:MAG: TetR/AcrR family transcriptional regulator [Acidimicrobiales bacterium]